MIKVEKTTSYFDILYNICKNVINLKDPRFHINHFKVEKSEIIATDGRCMVVGKSTLQDGYYTPKSIKKSEIILEENPEEHYPDFTIVTEQKYTNHECLKSEHMFPDHLTAIVCIETNIPLSSNYVMLAHTFGFDMIRYTDDTKPVVFINDNVTTYVMPIRR